MGRRGWGVQGALLRASMEGDAEVVRRLAATAGVDVNAVDGDEWGRGPLHRASWAGHARAVEALLEAPGADVNRVNRFGMTPLSTASNRGHAGVVRVLLGAAGVDVNRATKGGQVPLHHAAWEGHADVVELLLRAPGVEVDRADACGWTPLYAASSQGHVAVAEALLNSGADPSAKDARGLSLLDAACRRLPGLCTPDWALTPVRARRLPGPDCTVRAVQRRLGPLLRVLFLANMPQPLAQRFALCALADDPSAHLVALLLRAGARPCA